jgi:hypothetical protein
MSFPKSVIGLNESTSHTSFKEADIRSHQRERHQKRIPTHRDRTKKTSFLATAETDWRSFGCRSSRIRLPGDHDGSAGTAQLGQIAGGGRADLEAWAFPANDRTIGVRL